MAKAAEYCRPRNSPQPAKARLAAPTRKPHQQAALHRSRHNVRIFTLRQVCNSRPVQSKLPGNRLHRVKADGFRDKRTGSAFVRSQNVGFLFAGCEQHDGNIRQQNVRPHFGQNFEPVLARHVDVHQDEPRAFRIAELTLSTKELQRLLAVFDRTNESNHRTITESFFQQDNVVFAVVDNQDFNGPFATGPVRFGQLFKAPNRQLGRVRIRPG